MHRVLGLRDWVLRHGCLLSTGWVMGVTSLHLAALLHFGAPVINSPDANGYYVQASRLARSGTVELGVEGPLDFIGSQWLDVRDGRFYSKYAPGVGVLLAPIYALLGPRAALCVTPLLASLSLVLLYLVGRPLLGDGLAAVGATLYALQPEANLQAQNWGAHTHVAFGLLSSVWLLQRWARTPGPGWALGCGSALGFIPLMRPPDALLGAGALAFVALQLGRRGALSTPHLRSLPAMALGSAAALAALALHNTVAFGGPLTTGYALTHEQTPGVAFSLENLRGALGPLLARLAFDGAGWLFPFGLAGLGLMLAAPATRALAALALGSIAPSTLLYAAYYWSLPSGARGPELRYLVPLLPLFVVPALWVLQRAFVERRLRNVAVAALVVAQAARWAPQTAAGLTRTAEVLRPLHELTEQLERALPEGSALVVEPLLGESLQYFARWRVLDAGVALGVSMPGVPRGSTGAAHPLQPDKARGLRAELDALDAPERAARIEALLRELERAQSGGLYWVLPEPVAGVLEPLGGAFRLERVLEYRAPGVPPASHQGSTSAGTEPAGRKPCPEPGTTYVAYRLSPLKGSR